MKVKLNYEDIISSAVKDKSISEKIMRIMEKCRNNPRIINSSLSPKKEEKSKMRSSYDARSISNQIVKEK